MAEGRTLAKAYVQMIPTTKGFKGALESSAGSDIDSAGASFGKRLGSGLVKAIAAAGIGVALKKVLGDAVSEGAALEQSIGGIKTLFGTADMSIEEYAKSVGKSVDEVRGKYESLSRAENAMLTFAKNAYKDAGLSANDYMEQASSFAASLVSAMGGDTEKAAKTANMAMVDMSDNANKMGTDIGSIQNAYQGFAKQNYTMLDNLKLGYGGTQQEMQRLLKDAEEFSGVKYDINNLNDVYNAIHVIQEEMGIAGTTAKEAATTFSGSWGMVKAAYANVLGYLATGQTDEAFDAMHNLIDSIHVFLFDNCLPMIGRFISQLPSLVAAGLRDLAGRMKESALSGAGEFIKTFLKSLPDMVAAVAELVSAAIDWIRRNWPEIKRIAKECLDAFIDGLKEAFPQFSGVIDDILPILEKVPQAILSWKIAKLIHGAFSGVGGVIAKITGFFAPMTAAFSAAGGGFAGLKAAFVAIGGPIALVVGAIAVLVGAFVSLWKNNEDFRNKMTEIWEDIVGKFKDFFQGITDRINALGFDFENFGEVMEAAWQGICDFLQPVFEAAWEGISLVMGTAFDVILGIIDTFTALFNGDWDSFWQGIRDIVDTVWQGIHDLISIAIEMVADCISEFLSWFGIEWSADLTQIQNVWNEIWTVIGDFLSSIITTIQEVIEGFISLFNGDWDGFCQHLSNAWSSLWEGVSNFASEIWNAISTIATDIFGKIKKAITDKWDEIKKGIKDGWDGVKDTLSRAWNDILAKAREIFENIKQAICKPFEEAKNFVSGVWDWLTGHNHIEVSVDTKGTGSGGSHAVPHAAGGIFQTATFFPDVTGGPGNIVGEAGAEAVLPLSQFYKELDRSIEAGYMRSAADPRADRIIELLEAILGKSSAVYIDKNRLVGEIASDIESLNGRSSQRLARIGGVR